MTYVKNNPYNIFDEIFNGFPANWGKDTQSATGVPAANINETKDAYHVELNVPGRNKEDFSINVENGLLTIGYEKKASTETQEFKTIRREFSFRSFKRSFSLDDKINAAGIQAKYENGILQILLPKKDEVKAAPTQIAVN
jgi:HSP20 family protein